MTPLTELIVVSETKWKDVKFGGIDQGNACKIRNISSIYGRHDELIEDILKRFERFCIEESY